MRSPLRRVLLVEFLLLLFLGSCRGSPLADTRPPPQLTAMTFNVRYATAPDGEDAWPKRRSLMFHVIEEADPDVLGLQEALKGQVDELVEALPQYRAIRVGRDDGQDKGESCAILYRASRLRLEETRTFWLSDTPEIVGSNTWHAACTRICTWARLTDARTGRGFYFFNTHLDHVSQPAREKGVALILDRIAHRERLDEPVLFMGDFNSGESNSAIKLALAATRPGAAFTDTFRAVHPGERIVGTFNNFKNKEDGEKIDYILASHGVRTLGAQIIRTNANGHTPSDHFPVTARIELP